MDVLEEFFVDAGFSKPDYILEGPIFDPTYCEVHNLKMPLSETKENDYQLPGCYAWFEPQVNHKVKVMYVGKAVKLRARLYKHWNHYSWFLNQWFQLHNAQDLPFCPFVAVWLSDNRAALESKMITKLNPCFNRRKE